MELTYGITIRFADVDATEIVYSPLFSLLPAVTVPRIGKTSVDFAFEARSKATPEATHWNLAARSRVTKVCTSMDDLTPREIPQDLRPSLERYGSTS